MGKILKNYLINIILFIVGSLFLIISLDSSSPLLIILNLTVLALSYVWKPKNVKKNRYYLYDPYKTSLLLVLLILTNTCEILAVTVNGWEALGYLALLILILLFTVFTQLLNLIVRLYYRLKYNQTFNFKTIFKKHIIVKIIILLLILSMIIIVVTR